MKKNKYALQRIKVVCLCFASVLLSCENLEENPTSFISPNNFYQTIGQGETALAASLSAIWNEWSNYGYSYGYQFFKHADDQMNYRDLIIPADKGDYLWRGHYTALLNINAVLKSIRENRMEGEQEEIDILVGQAKFLRAYNYFMLVRLFGGVPLYTDENEDPTSNPLARSSISEVYDLITSDLIEAQSKLPVQWPDKPGRITKYAASTLLAKVYITMATAPLNATENYANARDVALTIINAGDSPYGLQENVHDVFKKENKFGKEMIWSFQSNSEDVQTSANIWGPGEMGGWSDCISNAFFEESWPEQPRKEAYLLTELVLDDGSILPYQEWGAQSPACKKYMMPYITIEEWNSYVSYANFPILRYPEVLLIFAEAENMVNNGPTQAAVEAINQVIDRANGWEENPNYPRVTLAMSAEEFDDAVIRERNFELCFEFDRYFDLIRKRILDVVNPETIENFSEDDYLFPIPQLDLAENPLLTQNPGYPSP